MNPFMSIMDRLKKQEEREKHNSTEIAKEQVEVVAAVKKMRFIREWKCECGAMLRIRARNDRADGPSNVALYPANHPLYGHSRIPSGELTWNGLAEERGWSTKEAKPKCPACVVGIPVAEYKKIRRKAREQGAI